MFPLHEIAEILRTASEDIVLINSVIKFHLAQRMWSGIINVRDGQTDRRTDVIRRQYRSIAIAWSGKKEIPQLDGLFTYKKRKIYNIDVVSPILKRYRNDNDIEISIFSLTISIRGVDPYGTGGTRPPVQILGDVSPLSHRDRRPWSISSRKISKFRYRYRFDIVSISAKRRRCCIFFFFCR